MDPTKATLILAGNSIGNPEDIPLRTLSGLQSADMLIFEEDRGARQALKAAGIHRDYYKFTEHMEEDTIEECEQAFLNGKTVLYMSDQGMPTVADPGKQLAKLAYELGVRVTVIPGPSSITSALAACPFLGNGFDYAGFLPRDESLRLTILKEKLSSPRPVVILDTPYRMKALIEACQKSTKDGREALLAIDISGPNENFINDTLDGLLSYATKNKEKLNFVLIIDGDPKKKDQGKSTSKDHKGKKRSKKGGRR